MYTAKEVDNMSMEEIDSLAQTLTQEQLTKWAGLSYSGQGYINITK